MGKKAKNAIKDTFKGLTKATNKAKARFDASLAKAKLGNYTGADLVEDAFGQAQDLWEMWWNIGSPERQVAYIYLPADGSNNVNWDSNDLELDEPVNQAYLNNTLTKTDLLGAVVAGVQKTIPKANVALVLKNPVNGVSTDFFVRIRQTPAVGDTGDYRGLIIDGGFLIAEVVVNAHS